MIPFTQYLMPDGRRRDDGIDRPADIEEMAKAIIAAGGRFEAEVLRTGHVSFECFREVDGEVQTLSMQVVVNGPEVLAAVDTLVKQAHAALGQTDTVTMEVRR